MLDQPTKSLCLVHSMTAWESICLAHSWEILFAMESLLLATWPMAEAQEYPEARK